MHVRTISLVSTSDLIRNFALETRYGLDCLGFARHVLLGQV
jgi:hypothetical protein